MIKLHVTFENKCSDSKAEDTVVSAKFKTINDVHEWLDKISALNEDTKLKCTPGFIQPSKRKEKKNVNSPT